MFGGEKIIDTSETYIKMCREAKEIQKEWKPDIGDYISMCDPGLVSCKIIISQTMGDRIVSIGVNDIGLIYGIPRGKSGAAVWLSRQDQLQEMVIEKQGWRNANRDLLSLNRNFSKRSEELLDLIKSYEQFWLLFVMLELYQKRWNGETWIPV